MIMQAYARAVLGVVILSVCPSVTRVDCNKTKWCTADIFMPHERAITLLLWHQQRLEGDAPSLWNLRSKWPTPSKKRRFRLISAYNVSTVTDTEKSSIITNSTMRFPTSYRWSVYVTNKSRRVAKKQFFCFLNKSPLQSNSPLQSFLVWKLRAAKF